MNSLAFSRHNFVNMLFVQMHSKFSDNGHMKRFYEDNLVCLDAGHNTMYEGFRGKHDKYHSCNFTQTKMTCFFYVQLGHHLIYKKNSICIIISII